MSKNIIVILAILSSLMVIADDQKPEEIASTADKAPKFVSEKTSHNLKN